MSQEYRKIVLDPPLLQHPEQFVGMLRAVLEAGGSRLREIHLIIPGREVRPIGTDYGRHDPKNNFSNKPSG